MLDMNSEKGYSRARAQLDQEFIYGKTCVVSAKATMCLREKYDRS